MRKLWLFLVAFLLIQYGRSQETTLVQMLEDQATVDDTRETEEDLQQLQYLLRHPLNLNIAEPEDMSVFPFVTSLQAERLVLYRKMLGPLQHLLELQAVPGWTSDLIRKILPYVTVSVQTGFIDELRSAARQGRHQLLTRMTMRSSDGNKYLGSQPSVLLRYQFRSKYLQMALNTEKDMGERFLQKGHGISFVSFHAAINGKGFIKMLVIGDYLVNMGQGLIHWQGRSVRKTGMPVMIKRQLGLIQPYKSNDENRFHRGIALITKIGRIDATVFFSINNMDANRKLDTVSGKPFVSSFISSGYHRTISELEDKDVMQVKTAGSSIAYRRGEFRSGINVIHHFFSMPLIRENEPYHVFAFQGTHMSNYSLDYQHTLRNIHIFGEIALDEKNHLAILQGMMFSTDPRLDLSFLLRKISRNYHALQGNAFTESTEPANEEGIYTGMSFRISPTLTVDAYLDHYRFPWLKYRLDMPGWGRDYFLQCSWHPNKKTSLYGRFHRELRTESMPTSDQYIPATFMNLPISDQLTAVSDNMKMVGILRKMNWRFHLDQKFSLQVEWRLRVEYISIFPAGKSMNNSQQETGYLVFSDIFWSPSQSHFSFNTRLMTYETTNYTSRIYAFENDVMYYNIVPASYGKGSLAYINARFSPTKQVQFFLKIAVQQKKVPAEIRWMVRTQLIFSW